MTRPPHHGDADRHRGAWRRWSAALAGGAATFLPTAPAAGFHGGAHGGGALVMLGLWLVAAVALALMVMTWLRDRREARQDPRPPPTSDGAP